MERENIIDGMPVTGILIQILVAAGQCSGG
jgi:hypothetical protein